MSSAPDYAEALVAWRVWRVVDGPDGRGLRSVVFPASWIPGQELVAECKCRSRKPLTPWRYRRCESAPSRGCDCGIYGARRIANAVEYLGSMFLASTIGGWNPFQAVVGRVCLWGEVVEHRLGWRASRAYPALIYVPRAPGSDEVAAGLAVYGVPVEEFECSGRGDVQAALERLTPERR